VSKAGASVVSDVLPASSVSAITLAIHRLNEMTAKDSRGRSIGSDYPRTAVECFVNSKAVRFCTGYVIHENADLIEITSVAPNEIN
jgi:hypothetical protein